MGEQSAVTEIECSGRTHAIYERLNKTDTALAKIYGGLAVVVFVAAFIVAMVSSNINRRFSGVEKSIDKMDTRLIKYFEPSTKRHGKKSGI